MLYFLVFVVAVVLEYHFGLYVRTQAVVVYLFTQIYRFFNWIWQIIARLFQWIGGVLMATLAFIARCLEWLLGLLPWWLLALILFLLVLVAALGLGMYFLAGLFLLGLLALLLWNSLWAILLGLMLAMLAIFAWFADLFSGFGKWIAGLLSAFALSIPTCSTAPTVQQEQAPHAVKQADSVVVVPPVSHESIVVFIQPGDGTIRATARGGYPLDLNESIAWTHGQGLVVRKVRGFVHAPTLYLGDTLEYKDGQWVLHRPNK